MMYNVVVNNMATGEEKVIASFCEKKEAVWYFMELLEHESFYGEGNVELLVLKGERNVVSAVAKDNLQVDMYFGK